MTIGSVVDIDKPQNVKYEVVAQHRNYTNNNKSRWIISINEEVNCFTRTYNNSWIYGNIGWGLHLNGVNIEVLGKNPQSEDLKIAKFIDSSNNGHWHGYPADYRNKNNEDRPSNETLLKWNKAGLIEKHQICRIRSGKRCAL